MEPVVYVLLFVTSVVGFTFIVERGIALRWRRGVPSQVEAAVESCQAPEDVPMLRRVWQQDKSPTSRLLLLAAEPLADPATHPLRPADPHPLAHLLELLHEEGRVNRGRDGVSVR